MRDLLLKLEMVWPKELDLTNEMPVYCEERRPSVEVDTTPNNVTSIISWAETGHMLTAFKYFSVVAMISPGSSIPP